MSTNQSKLTVIGVGNLFRGDDGAGIVVARRIHARVPCGVTIVEVSGEGASLLDVWAGATSLILVDAVCSGAKPGTIHRFDAAATPLPKGIFRFSTHGLGVAEAFELAGTLNRLPSRLIVYGIEGDNFETGVQLSAAVERATTAAADRVLQELSVLLN
jgi:hydrogenase maturation protease